MSECGKTLNARETMHGYFFLRIWLNVIIFDDFLLPCWWTQFLVLCCELRVERYILEQISSAGCKDLGHNALCWWDQKRLLSGGLRRCPASRSSFLTFNKNLSYGFKFWWHALIMPNERPTELLESWIKYLGVVWHCVVGNALCWARFVKIYITNTFNCDRCIKKKEREKSWKSGKITSLGNALCWARCVSILMWPMQQ